MTDQQQTLMTKQPNIIEPIKSTEQCIPKFKILDNTSETEIKYIYHISDVHIQYSDRRDAEYQKIFNKLYEIILTDSANHLDSSIIVITGDVVDKHSICSKYTKETTRYFFNMLSSILPVFVIDGNHDQDVRDLETIGVFSTKILNSKYLSDNGCVYYLRDSGVYQYSNILFAVSSRCDNSSFIQYSCIPDDCIQSIKKYSHPRIISLYHGSIFDSDLPEKMKRTFQGNDGVILDGFDMAILGDGHYYRLINNRKNFAYAGSLIQQNFGEKIEHGILKWNVNSRNHTFIEIPNEYQFITLDVVRGQLENVHDNIPKNARIRLRYDCNSNFTHLNEIEHNLTKKFNVTNFFRFPDKKSEKDEMNDDDYSNFFDKDVFSKITSDYIETCRTFATPKDKIFQTIMHAYDKVIESYNEKAFKRQLWVPIQLQFSNIFCFGPDNVVDFEILPNGIVHIRAPNGFGKSFFIDIIIFCLFGKIPRFDGNNVVNNNSNYFRCSLKLTINKKIYLIERSGKKNDYSLSVTTQCFFYKIHGEVKKSLTCDSVDKTNNAIVNIFGSYEHFISTTCFLQPNNGGNLIIALDSEHVVSYFSQLFGYNLFSRVSEYLSKKNKKYCAKLKTIFKSKKALDAAIRKNERDIEKLENDLVIVSEQISIFKRLNESYPTDFSLITECVKQIRDIEKEIENTTSGRKLELLNSTLLDLKVKHSDLSISHFESLVKKEKIIKKKDLPPLEKLTKNKQYIVDSLESKKELSDQLKQKFIDYEKYNRLQLMYSNSYDAVTFAKIPAPIFRHTANLIQKKANKILTSLNSGIFVKISFDDVVKGKVKVMDFTVEYAHSNAADKFINILLSSGAEKIYIDLAFKIIFSQLARYPHPGFIFFDETLSGLDKHKQENIGAFFELLKEYYSHIFIIQHTDFFIDYVDSVIDIIQNSDGLSFVTI